MRTADADGRAGGPPPLPRSTMHFVMTLVIRRFERSPRTGFRPLAILAIATSATLAILGSGGCDRPGPAPVADAPTAQPAAATAPPKEGQKDPAKDPATASSSASRSASDKLFVVFESMSGRIRLELHPKEAPRTCANFINLVQRGYYVGRPWEDFSPVVRQVGPAASIVRLPYTLPREPSPKLLFDVGGRLAAANATTEPGSRVHPVRVFLTTKPQERWNLEYVVFGTVVEGLDVVQRLVVTEPVSKVSIEGDPSALLATYATQLAEWNRLLDEKPIDTP